MKKVKNFDKFVSEGDYRYNDKLDGLTMDQLRDEVKDLEEGPGPRNYVELGKFMVQRTKGDSFKVQTMKAAVSDGEERMIDGLENLYKFLTSNG